MNYGIAICNDKNYSYYLFAQLLKKAGLIENNQIKGLSESRFVAFIPTNDAFKTALNSNLIPGVSGCTVDASGELQGGTFNQTTLSRYLLSHFITSAINGITSYPYPGSEVKSGTYITAAYSNFIYTDNGTDLSVQIEGNGKTGRVIANYNYFPFAYEDGCFHLIDSTL